MNTRIEYAYRDGANYKASGHIIVSGEPGEDLVQRLTDACMDEDEHAFFVPESVGMARLPTWEWDDEVDHPFHTLEDVVPTDEPPTDARALVDLVKDFESKDWTQESVDHPMVSGAPHTMPIQRADARAITNIMR